MDASTSFPPRDRRVLRALTQWGLPAWVPLAVLLACGQPSGGIPDGSGGAAPSGGGEGGISETSDGTAAGGASVLPLSGEPCAGFTLITSPENDAGADFDAFLVDMSGNVVHTWPITGFPAKMLPGGSLLGCEGVVSGSYDCRRLSQVNFQGEEEWHFEEFSEDASGQVGARQHHEVARSGSGVGYFFPDMKVDPRGKTLVLAHDDAEREDLRPGPVEDDVIYEVDWEGNVQVLWRGVEHLEELGFDEQARADLRTRREGSKIEWLHGNSVTRVGENPWFDAGHLEFHPENLLYSSRHANLVLILDRLSGEVVWRLGPQFEGRPEQKLGQFVGQHAPHLIPRGLPGAGNLLVFDNGGASGYGGPATSGNPNRNTRDYSRVLEFNPITFEIVWEYGRSEGEERFFSVFVSNAQRLPNGNTMITIGLESRVIEVTPDHRVVWEYDFEASSSGANASWIYRSYRVPSEWLPDGSPLRDMYPAWTQLFAFN